MLIAQITDLHVGFVPDDPEEANAQRLRAVVAAICALDPAPDLVLATGDLTEAGTPNSYRDLKAILNSLPMPVHFAMGNHDERASFRAQFPDTPVDDDGFVQYVVEGYDLRVIVLDTLEPGRHGGSFCEKRADWLEARLSEAHGVPTLIVLHHPPIDTGIPWMTINPGDKWVARLEAVVARHPQVRGLVSGHVHRTILSAFAGTYVTVVPSTAPQVALDFRPMDPQIADDRPLIALEPPAYGLHRWENGKLSTHVVFTGEHRVVARYDRSLQPMIQHMLAERDGGG